MKNAMMSLSWIINDQYQTDGCECSSTNINTKKIEDVFLATAL